MRLQKVDMIIRRKERTLDSLIKSDFGTGANGVPALQSSGWQSWCVRAPLLPTPKLEFQDHSIVNSLPHALRLTKDWVTQAHQRVTCANWPWAIITSRPSDRPRQRLHSRERDLPSSTFCLWHRSPFTSSVRARNFSRPSSMTFKPSRMTWLSTISMSSSMHSTWSVNSSSVATFFAASRASCAVVRSVSSFSTISSNRRSSLSKSSMKIFQVSTAASRYCFHDACGFQERCLRIPMFCHSFVELGRGRLVVQNIGFLGQGLQLQIVLGLEHRDDFLKLGLRFGWRRCRGLLLFCVAKTESAPSENCFDQNDLSDAPNLPRSSRASRSFMKHRLDVVASVWWAV